MDSVVSNNKLFFKYSYDNLEIKNNSIADYMKLDQSGEVFVPHTGINFQNKKFGRAQRPLIERLVNFMMRHGRNTGKKTLSIKIVEGAFDIMHLLTGKNPIQLLVTAIENCGPREDTTRVGPRGVARMQAVDVSPFRRVNLALANMTKGARKNAFKSSKTIAEALADEIIAASSNDAQRSFAIKQKINVERLAKPNR
eukprot:GAHX01000109.1.p1 GENE.GAHX01000109.1~~GAHX01000109.1.p1  ORF type:complete len:210 (+),score=38.15 GAHX01000109.1:41-631(+)